MSTKAQDLVRGVTASAFDDVQRMRSAIFGPLPDEAYEEYFVRAHREMVILPPLDPPSPPWWKFWRR